MTDRAPVRLRGPVLDAGDAVQLAHFYAALLDWEVVDEYAGDEGSWALIASPGGERKMELQGLADYVPPSWPNAPGEQQMMMHLDLAVGVLGGPEGVDPRVRYAAVVEHAVALGATVAEHQPHPDRQTVLLDPAGHPFCLVPGPVDG